jgi:ABC-type multidrug transport system fused ATPase/permease subunit
MFHSSIVSNLVVDPSERQLKPLFERQNYEVNFFQEGTVSGKVFDEKNSIEIDNASFAWDRATAEPTLKDISLKYCS